MAVWDTRDLRRRNLKQRVVYRVSILLLAKRPEIWRVEGQQRKSHQMSTRRLCSLDAQKMMCKTLREANARTLVGNRCENSTAVWEPRGTQGYHVIWTCHFGPRRFVLGVHSHAVTRLPGEPLYMKKPQKPKSRLNDPIWEQATTSPNLRINQRCQAQGPALQGAQEVLLNKFWRRNWGLGKATSSAAMAAKRCMRPSRGHGLV